MTVCFVGSIFEFVFCVGKSYDDTYSDSDGKTYRYQKMKYLVIKSGKIC
jgi:hypothetical protein